MTFSYTDSNTGSYPKMLSDMFVDLADPQSALPILHQTFPTWASPSKIQVQQEAAKSLTATIENSDNDNTPLIRIDQLTGGITNKLFQVTHTPSGTKVLIRAYGKGTSAIIDRDREVSTHMHLHSKGLAPPLYARFGNGLVYSYMPGKAIDYKYLSDPEVSHAIAVRLAEWHAKLDPLAVEVLIARQKSEREEQLKINKSDSSKSNKKESQDFSKNIWELLKSWIEIMPENVVKTYTREDLQKELKWICENIGSSGGNLVVAHCDLLAGNVIVPGNWTPKLNSESISAVASGDNEAAHPLEVSFIDYEYAMLAPRAFDLANHFMEWQGFDCVTELIPEPSLSNPVLRRWAVSYIGETQTERDVTAAEIDELLQQVLTYWGMPGFYWGIWASIQSVISDIDFDYASYANLRLEEYRNWKTLHAAISGRGTGSSESTGSCA